MRKELRLKLRAQKPTSRRELRPFPRFLLCHSVTYKGLKLLSGDRLLLAAFSLFRPTTPDPKRKLVFSALPLKLSNCLGC